MRIRTVKPEFWSNEELSTVSVEAVLLGLGLLNYSDDEGYFRARPALIKAAIFPIRKTKAIPLLLSELEAIQYIELFDGQDGKTYGRVKTFAEHQRVNRPTPSKIRPLCEAPGSTLGGDLSTLIEHSLSPHGSITAGKEGKGRERKGKEGKGSARRREVRPAEKDILKACNLYRQAATKWGFPVRLGGAIDDNIAKRVQAKTAMPKIIEAMRHLLDHEPDATRIKRVGKYFNMAWLMRLRASEEGGGHPVNRIEEILQGLWDQATNTKTKDANSEAAAIDAQLEEMRRNGEPVCD